MAGRRAIGGFKGGIGFLLLWIPMFAVGAANDGTAVPRYKPSSRSPAPLDIRTNAYGASRFAPGALELGDVAPDFTVPRAGGGTVALSEARRNGPVALIFYRGHW